MTEPAPRTQARVPVNLTARATTALDQTVELTSHTQTDVINRALQVYAHIEQALARGEQLFVEQPDGSRHSLRFF